MNYLEKLIKSYEYQDYEDYFRARRYTESWEKSRVLKAITLTEKLTNEEKIKILKDNVWTNDSSKYSGWLKQSLYNLLEMANNETDLAVIGPNKVATFKNLVRDNFVYEDYEVVEIEVEHPIYGTIKTKKTISFIKLTPLGAKKFDSMVKRAKEIAEKEMNRLKRLGVA